LTSFGKLELKKQHILCGGTSKFGISKRMQVLMCLVGQSVVYAEASELFKELIDIEVAAPQIQRVCLYYGESIDSLITSNCESILPKLEVKSKEDTTYVMVDGAMLFTREDQWKELKLGRIFQQSEVVATHTNRKEIRRSIYVSHLGSVETFFPKFERHLVAYKNKVIIGDGAKWIWNWAEDNYPGALQILDFYHAKEKLVLFAKYQFKEEANRKNWVKEQLEKLLDNRLEEVLATIRSCRSSGEEAKLAKKKLIDYYTQHEERMQYKTYRDKGLMIGSGPIEAAHRSVIQQRMKLSGQKWSIQGANALANLRCYRSSGAWDLVEKIIATAA